MWDTSVIWIVPIAIALHNIEEALWLPAWSEKKAGRWHRPTGVFAFRFAVIILTSVAVCVAILAQLGGHGAVGYYLLAAYAIGQSVNIFIPHILATIATRTYAPGLASGLLFVWPASAVFLTEAFSSPEFNLQRFLVVAIVFIPLMVLSIPVLLKTGRLLENKLINKTSNNQDIDDGK